MTTGPNTDYSAAEPDEVPAAWDLSSTAPTYTSQPYSQPDAAEPQPFAPVAELQPYPPLFSSQPDQPFLTAYPAQPFAAQPYSAQPFSAQPFSPQPFSPQSFSPQPFSAQSFSPQPFSPQPFSPQPYSTQPYSTQPYPAQPFATQAPPTQSDLAEPVFQPYQPSLEPRPTIPPYVMSGYSPSAYPAPTGFNTGSDKLGVAALICGLASFTILPVILAIPAIVLGVMGRRAAGDGLTDGRGMATAGLVLGLINCALLLVAVVLFVAFVITLA